MIPVLLYHDISIRRRDEYTVSAAVFASQMEWLYSNGYKAVFFGDLSSADIPVDPVIITFDDGYASFMDYAYPLLRGYGFKATINVIGEYVGTYVPELWNAPMLSWDEYRFLSDEGGVEIGCHTDRLHAYAHKGAEGVPISMLKEDLERFQGKMLRELGKTASVLAWPYGLFSEDMLNAAAVSGFKYILTSKPSMIKLTGKTDHIPRINVEGDVGLTRFRTLIGAKQ